jgi:hypothetical protein
MRKDFLKRVCAGVAAIPLLAASLVVVAPTVAHADVIGEEECYPAVLMLRGSAETQLPLGEDEKVTYLSGQGVPYVKTNGFEGPVLSRAIDALVRQTNPVETVSKLRFIGIDYPAAPVLPPVEITSTIGSLTIGHLVDYEDSFRTGAENVVKFINEDLKRGCNTQYTLLAYSQGVMAARLAMNLMDNKTDKIISSYMIGDPLQKANGAISSRQKSEANTSPDTYGSLRATMMYLGKSLRQGGSFGETVFSYAKWLLNEYVRSDSGVYRDDGPDGIVSRSLCHKFDPTCWTITSTPNISEHLNYFQEEDLNSSEPQSGGVDRLFEPQEFDKQVKKLAESQTSDSRAVSLVSTPTIKNKIVTYSVANARADDLCSWDEGADGVYEKENVYCLDLYQATSSADTIKMKVDVVNSFQIKKTLTTDSPTIDTKLLKEFVNSYSGSWFQYSPIVQAQGGSECIGFHSGGRDITIDEAINNPRTRNNVITKSNCDFGSTSELSAAKAGTAFKAALFTSEDEVRPRLLSGYDDDYSLTFDPNNTDHPLIEKTSDSPHQDFYVNEVSRQDYTYSIVHGDHCISVDRMAPSPVTLAPCSSSDPKQLFYRFEVSSDTYTKGAFGKLSLEKDITPPPALQDTSIYFNESIKRLTINWSSVYERGDYVAGYRIYSQIGSDPEFYLNQSINFGNYAYLNLSAYPSGTDLTIRTTSVDWAGLESAPTDITFVIP